MGYKKKNHAYHCQICDEYLPKEQFTDQGYAQHICKDCQCLPIEKQEDMKRCIEIEEMASKFPISRHNWELLDKYARIYKDLQSGKFAQEMLDMKKECSEKYEIDSLIESYETGDIRFLELEEDMRYELDKILERNIHDFILEKNYIPEDWHFKEIIILALKEAYDVFLLRVVPDEGLHNLAHEILYDVITQWKEDGLEIKSYSESLILMETDRLYIRMLTEQDLGPLLSIMRKPEVMYAWDHCFIKAEVRKWINKQCIRYHKDGFGIYAVYLKENNMLIGQVGLTKHEINDQDTVELTYMLDNSYWHKGYALESAHACLDYATRQLEIKDIVCRISPENQPAVRVAEKLGMHPDGYHPVIHHGKDILHHIYRF